MVLLFSIWTYSSREDANIGEIELTNSEFSCKKNKKYDTYKGYFHLNSIEYFLSENFETCQNFINLVSGNTLKGRYLKGNHLIIDFYVNNKVYYKSSFIKLIYYVLFLSLIGWVFLRAPIKWLVRKYA